MDIVRGYVLADRYVIQRELGMGTFGKVIECLDMHPKVDLSTLAPPTATTTTTTTTAIATATRTPVRVAVKVVRAVRRYSKSAVTEVRGLWCHHLYYLSTTALFVVV